MQRKPDEYYQVYVLYSESDPTFVKVGETNNLKRVPYLIRAGYGGPSDWVHKVTFLADSKDAAQALESMINAKLYVLGVKLPKLFWDDLTDGRTNVGANECYRCHIDDVVAVGVEMADVYAKYIAKV